MKAFKAYKYIYIATYLAIIAGAVYKIVKKVTSEKSKKKARPLFESTQKTAEADRMLDIRGGYGALNAIEKMYPHEMMLVSTPKSRSFWDLSSQDKKTVAEMNSASSEATARVIDSIFQMRSSIRESELAAPKERRI
jgi:hypothetical protein